MTDADRIIWAYRFKTYREHELEAVVERGGEIADIARAEMVKRAEQQAGTGSSPPPLLGLG